MPPTLSSLPPPPTGQIGVTPESLGISSLPPPPQGQTGMTLDQLNAQSAHTPPLSNNGIPSVSVTGEESPIVAPFKTAANLPSSLYNFGKGMVNFLNPLTTIKTAQNLGTSIGEGLNEGNSPGQLLQGTLQNLPESAYHALVPAFLQHLFTGDTQNALATLEKDPVGQIAPLVIAARGAAETAGQGEAFDTAMSKIASPVTSPTAAITTLAGKGAAGLAGISTGSGASSVQAAFNDAPGFVDAMRGKIDPESVVQNAQNAVQNIVDNRRSSYLSSLDEIGKQTGSLDISPIQETLQSQLSNFGVKVADDGTLDFSRSSIANNGSARADIQGVFNTLKDWGTQQGDRTPVGIDTLKKQLGDFYSPSGSARALVQAVKSKVSSILNDQVPGYQDMTKSYQQASNLLSDIKSTTGVGGASKVDTIFTKLTSAMKTDNALRLEVLKQITEGGNQPDLVGEIAGMNMQSLVPKGLAGKMTDVGAAFAALRGMFDPNFLPILMSTSPRLVGEFLHALGIGTRAAAPILQAINTISAQIPTSVALGGASKENPLQAQSQLPMQ